MPRSAHSLAGHRPAGLDPAIEQQILAHAPRERDDPRRINAPPALLQAIGTNAPIEAIVLTADIRRSASILKESIDIAEYAKVLNDFVGEFRTVLSFHGGWYDKFTGDGFICYWLVDDSFAEKIDLALEFSCAVMRNFSTYYYPAFVANMRNVPAGIGLSVGVDAGPCYLTPIGGELTLIGSPIVGSVRMSDSSAPYRVILNAYPGSRLIDSLKDMSGELTDELGYRVTRCTSMTKEYAEGQITYAVDFVSKGARVFP